MCNVCSEYLKNNIYEFYNKIHDAGNGSTRVEAMLLDGVCVDGDASKTYLSIRFGNEAEDILDIKINNCPFCGKDISNPMDIE